jgi:undecaprenyl-diphosphatase
MVSLIQVIILSIVQGITEWLPISSSGHLAVIQKIFGFQDLSFDIFLHFAAIIAVLIVFNKQIIKLVNIKDKENLTYVGLLILGIIPAGIVGVLFEKKIESFFSSMFYLGIFFMISGIIVYITKFSNEKREKINLTDSLFIGIIQAISVVPGISRSGTSVGSGLIRGIKKDEAVKFSFFMAIPIILGATVFKAKDIFNSEINVWLLLVSFSVTLIVSIFSIKLLLKVIKSDKFYMFGVYNFLLGVLILVFSFFK